MCSVIAALHAIDPDTVGLSGYGKGGNYMYRQVARWSKQYRASETEPIDSMERLMEWLPSHIPAGEAVSIVHGDFRLDNLVFHPTEPRVIAVLDWELSTLGHPLADFSYHAMLWDLPPDLRGLAGTELASLGIPSRDSYIDRYCEISGQSRPGREEWDFFVGYNLFRGAAISQGIMKRAIDGSASSAYALEAGSRARALADAAWMRVRGLVG
jgi:aminoglycoside phosphotransferase (APT) family kinase protein